MKHKLQKLACLLVLACSNLGAGLTTQETLKDAIHKVNYEQFVETLSCSAPEDFADILEEILQTPRLRYKGDRARFFCTAAEFAQSAGIDVKKIAIEKQLMHQAAEKGNNKIFYYLSHQFNVCITQKTPKTKVSPIFMAAVKGHKRFFMKLASYYSPEELQSQYDSANHNLLHSAAEGGNFDIFSYLIDKGLNPKAKNDVGWDVLYYAVLNNNLDIVEFLDKNYGLNSFVLVVKTKKGEESLIDLARKYGADDALEYLKTSLVSKK